MASEKVAIPHTQYIEKMPESVSKVVLRSLSCVMHVESKSGFPDSGRF